MAPVTMPRCSGGKRKWQVVKPLPANSAALKGFFKELPPRATKPRSGAAAADSVQASDREDEATVVDIMTQPKEVDACSQLPQQDDSGKVGLGSQLPKSVVDMTAAECLELFQQITGGGESDDEQCAAMARATLTATEGDHGNLIQQLEKQPRQRG